jgi:tetratricopeptide (TPR) repeat protein
MKPRRAVFLLAFFLLWTLPLPGLFSLESAQSSRSSSSLESQYQEYASKGEEFRLQGQYEKAIEEYKKALSLAQRASNRTNEIDSLLKLGLLHWNRGALDDSASFYSKALSIAQSVQEENKTQQAQDALEIFRLYNEAKDHRTNNDYTKSNETFDTAIALAQKIGSREHEVKCIRQKSINFYRTEDLKTYASLNQEGLELARALNHLLEEYRFLYNLGLYYDESSQYPQALKHYDEALIIAREIENPGYTSACLTNTGRIYNDIGDFDKALEYLTEALEIDRELRDQSYITLNLLNIGSAFRRKGLVSRERDDFHKAQEFFQDCLSLSRKIGDRKREIRALNNIGTVNTDLGYYPEAIASFQEGLAKAETSKDVEAQGMLLTNIGIVYSNQGDYERSNDYYQRAIDLAITISGNQILWEAYLEIANALNKQERHEEAVENYKRSISIIEEVRSQIELEEYKARYLGTDKRLEAFHNLIHLLIHLNQAHRDPSSDEEAFNYLERAKARAFLDSLEVSKVDISEGVDLDLLNQEK